MIYTNFKLLFSKIDPTIDDNGIINFKGKKYWITLTRHHKDCDCSYCKSSGTTFRYEKLRYGLNRPIIKDGWWVIKLWRGLYLKIIK